MRTNKTDNLDFSELDFDEVRASIVDFLRTKTEFEDFDFQGSAISLLVDALAYTQTYMAVHANMAVAETFLQSARLRSNIVARAKELGYIPYSKRSSEAQLVMRYTGNTRFDLQPVLKRGMVFKSKSRNFVLTEDYIMTRVGQTNDKTPIFETEITVREGRMTEHSLIYTIDHKDQPRRTWRIPDQDIDLDSLKVTTGSGTRQRIWRNGNSAVDIDHDSLYYFVQEDGDGYYVIYFGDDILGKRPRDGVEVTLEYVRTAGLEGNGQLVNGYASPIVDNEDPEGNYSLVYLPETVTRSHSGNNRENTESIRSRAPSFFQAQNRAVTRNDYMALVMNEYNFIEAINVWGGEENQPPQYGVVFIALKPKSGSTISTPLKKEIEDNIRSKYSVLTIQPRVVDAEYIYITVDSTVSYQPHNTNKTKGQIVEMIRDNVQEYFDTELVDFDSTVRYSRLVSVIDDSDTSLIGNVSRVKLMKRLETRVNQITEYTLRFFNELTPGTIESVPFGLNGSEYQFKDHGNGNIALYQNNVISHSRVGKVDYKNGVVNINRHVFAPGSPRVVEFEAKPIAKEDINSVRNGIVTYLRGRHEIELSPKQVKIL